MSSSKYPYIDYLEKKFKQLKNLKVDRRIY